MLNDAIMLMASIVLAVHIIQSRCADVRFTAVERPGSDRVTSGEEEGDVDYSSAHFVVSEQSTSASASSGTICPNRCDCFNGDETVDCSRRGFETVPAVSNETRRLYAEDNQIFSLANSQLYSAASLTLLVLERNFIDHVDAFESFCGLNELQELNLGANRIRVFEIGYRRSLPPLGDNESSNGCRLTSLKEINLGLNLLFEIPRNLSVFAPNLEILNLGYNEIESATLDDSFSNLVSLRYLDLSRNRIHVLDDNDLRPAAFVVPLEVLSLTECGLVRIGDRAFAGLVNLTSLSVSNNPIWTGSLRTALENIGRGYEDDRETATNATVDFSPASSSPSSASSSSASFSSSSPSSFPLSSVASSSSATFLSSSSESASSSASASFRSETLNFQVPANLSIERLSSNSTFTSQSTFTNQSFSPLARLDLSEVVLHNLTVEGLGRFVNLVVLDASYCDLEFVEPRLFDLLSAVETLHLEGGKLERVDNLVAARRLRRLHLQENRLTMTVDLSGLYSLETIDLSRNRIETIPGAWLTGLRGLQVLNLSHNLIRAIEPDSFHQVGIISTLDLSFNRLTTLGPFGLVRLERLDVSYNLIDRIDDNAFADLHQTLTELDLGHNHLTELNDQALSRSSSLQSLDVRHNNLHRQLELVADAKTISNNPFKKLQTLETLDLSDNGMVSFDCSLLFSTPHLMSLALRANRLADFQQASIACLPPSLVRLDLSANQISTVDVAALRRVTWPH